MWPCHSLRRPRFPLRRVYFRYWMTFAAYIWCFCAQISFDLVTLTLAMSDELSFVPPTHIPIFRILRLSFPELWMTQSDHIIITWNDHCANAVSRDLSPERKNYPCFWNPWHLCIGGPPKQPHVTILWPQIVYSLYNFYGAVMTIKGTFICEHSHVKVVFGHKKSSQNWSPKWRLKTRKKRKYGSKWNLYIGPHLRDRLDIEFTAC